MWFLLAFLNAITSSIYQAVSNWTVSLNKFSKITIALSASAIGSAILLFVSLVSGLPSIDPRFWKALLVTGLLNALAGPLLLKAYELGEFSSVFSMTLLTPVFLLLTSFFILGETPAFFGLVGVILTVIGLMIVSGNKEGKIQGAGKRLLAGNMLAILVAFIFSITVNFDKLSAQYSGAMFAAGAANGIVTLILGGALLAKNRRHLRNSFAALGGKDLGTLLLVGLACAANILLHNSALLLGPASYTIALKRTGVLLGVFWGWILFREKNVSRKLLGVLLAVLGVLTIVFSV